MVAFALIYRKFRELFYFCFFKDIIRSLQNSSKTLPFRPALTHHEEVNPAMVCLQFTLVYTHCYTDISIQINLHLST